MSADRSRGRARVSGRELWSRLQCWLSRACAARCTLGELEAALEHQLRQRDRAAAAGQHDADARALLAYLRDAIADTQSQIMQIEVRHVIDECVHAINSIRSNFICKRPKSRSKRLILTLYFAKESFYEFSENVIIALSGSKDQ